MTDHSNTEFPLSSAPNDVGVQNPAGSLLRQPRKADAAAIHRLISECPPLDLNSVYTYLLLSEHFNSTCVVAGRGELFDGFISGYIPPGRPNVLFIWQVAVHTRSRGVGLAGRMLDDLLQRPHLSAIEYVETTVGPDNRASRAMFARLARRLGAPVSESPLFERAHFGTLGHDDEPLLRIGPFRAITPEAPTEHLCSERIVTQSASQPGEEI